MARIRSMLGVIEGSAGGLTFSKQGGLNVLRQKVGRNGSQAPKQVAQRNKFALIGTLAKNIGMLLQAGFKKIGGASGYNRFVGENIRYTSSDQDLKASLDFSKVSVSSGSIPPLVGLAVADSPTGKTVSWTNNSDGVDALAGDKVYVAVVKTSTLESAESLGTATRAGGSVLVPAQYLIGLATGDLAVYAFAKRADNSEASATTRIAQAIQGGGNLTLDTTLNGPNGSAQGITLAASAGDVLKFNALTTGGSAPASMDINIGGAQVASVAYLDRYNGQPFSFTHAGVAHTGSFAAVVDF